MGVPPRPGSDTGNRHAANGLTAGAPLTTLTPFGTPKDDLVKEAAMAATNVGALRRRGRFGEEMRQDFLRAARAIIAEEGAGALSIRGIARRIGYSAPALYEYFDGKEAIARALYVEGFIALRAAMEEIERANPDPAARMAAMGHGYRRFALAHPQEYSLMFGRPIPEFVPSGEELGEISGAAFAPLQRAYADGISFSILRPMDARTAATIAWGMMHGLASLELAHMYGPPAGDCPPGLSAPAHIPEIYDEAFDALALAFRNT